MIEGCLAQLPKKWLGPPFFMKIVEWEGGITGVTAQTATPAILLLIQIASN
jgi:hypothetical protein